MSSAVDERPLAFPLPLVFSAIPHAMPQGIVALSRGVCATPCQGATVPRVMQAVPAPLRQCLHSSAAAAKAAPASAACAYDAAVSAVRLSRVACLQGAAVV